jgi:hypothetical protein
MQPPLTRFILSQADSMQFCEIERFHEGACQARSLDCICGCPLHRHQVAGACWLGCCTLPMTARETDCPHLPDISFFRYFVLAYTQRSRDDWAGASITRVCGKVKVLLSHFVVLWPFTRSVATEIPSYILVFTEGNLCSLLLVSSIPARHHRYRIVSKIDQSSHK